MKGLMQNCCQCNGLIEKNSIHMWCDCLTAMCKPCGLEQLSTKTNTYHSHLTCPVCGNQDTNVANGIIEGVAEADSLERELIKQACTYFQESRPQSFAKKTFKLLPLYQRLLKRYADLGLPKPPGGIDATHKEYLSIVALHIARCEAQRQHDLRMYNSNRFVDSGGKLALGPLQEVRFKANHTLEKVLDIIEGRDDVNRLHTGCNSCYDELTSGNTVRSICSCYNNACQLCVRRSIKNKKKTFLENPLPCMFCNIAAIPVGNIRAAQELQEQLLYQHPKFRKTTNVDTLWFVYMDIGSSCNMELSISYYDFIEPRNAQLGQGSNNLHTKPMCFLEMARMEVERVRRATYNVPKEEKSDVSNLPLGPLARLDIGRNVVLEAFLTFRRGGEAHQALYSSSRAVINAGAQMSDPGSLFDEATNRVCAVDAPGGELSDEVCQLVEQEMNTPEGKEEVDLGPRKLKLLIRTQSTPCPHAHCTVNPYCPVYLAKHIQTHHVDHVQDQMPVPAVTGRRRGRQPAAQRAALQESEFDEDDLNRALAESLVTSRAAAPSSDASSTASPSPVEVEILSTESEIALRVKDRHGAAAQTSASQPSAIQQGYFADVAGAAQKMPLEVQFADRGTAGSSPSSSENTTESQDEGNSTDEFFRQIAASTAESAQTLGATSVPARGERSASTVARRPVPRKPTVVESPTVGTAAKPSVSSKTGAPSTGSVSASSAAPVAEETAPAKAVRRIQKRKSAYQEASSEEDEAVTSASAPLAPLKARKIHPHSTANSSRGVSASGRIPASASDGRRHKEHHHERHRERQTERLSEHIEGLHDDQLHEHIDPKAAAREKTKATAIAEAATLQKRRDILLAANRVIGRTAEDVERRKREAAEAAQRPRKVRFAPAVHYQEYVAPEPSSDSDVEALDANGLPQDADDGILPPSETQSGDLATARPVSKAEDFFTVVDRLRKVTVVSATTAVLPPPPFRPLEISIRPPVPMTPRVPAEPRAPVSPPPPPPMELPAESREMQMQLLAQEEEQASDAGDEEEEEEEEDIEAEGEAAEEAVDEDDDQEFAGQQEGDEGLDSTPAAPPALPYTQLAERSVSMAGSLSAATAASGSSSVTAPTTTRNISGVAEDSPYAYPQSARSTIKEYRHESFVRYFQQPYRSEEQDQARSRASIPYNYYGLPYKEDMNRFSSPVLAKPGEAWRGGEEYVNLEHPDQRHYELCFDADSPREANPQRALTTRVEFFLIFPKGALKEVKDLEPCRDPDHSRVKIRIETTQAELNAVLKMLVLPKYGFRGRITQWASKRGGLLQAKGTFHKYSVRPGSDIVMRDISRFASSHRGSAAPNEKNYMQFWENKRKARKRMSNVEFALLAEQRQFEAKERERVARERGLTTDSSPASGAGSSMHATSTGGVGRVGGGPADQDQRSRWNHESTVNTSRAEWASDRFDLSPSSRSPPRGTSSPASWSNSSERTSNYDPRERQPGNQEGSGPLPTSRAYSPPVSFKITSSRKRMSNAAFAMQAEERKIQAAEAAQKAATDAAQAQAAAQRSQHSADGKRKRGGAMYQPEAPESGQTSSDDDDGETASNLPAAATLPVASFAASPVDGADSDPPVTDHDHDDRSAGDGNGAAMDTGSEGGNAGEGADGVADAGRSGDGFGGGGSDRSASDGDSDSDSDSEGQKAAGAGDAAESTETGSSSASEADREDDAESTPAKSTTVRTTACDIAVVDAHPVEAPDHVPVPEPVVGSANTVGTAAGAGVAADDNTAEETDGTEDISFFVLTSVKARAVSPSTASPASASAHVAGTQPSHPTTAVLLLKNSAKDSRPAVNAMDDALEMVDPAAVIVPPYEQPADEAMDVEALGDSSGGARAADHLDAATTLPVEVFVSVQEDQVRAAETHNDTDVAQTGEMLPNSTATQPPLVLTPPITDDVPVDSAAHEVALPDPNATATETTASDTVFSAHPTISAASEAAMETVIELSSDSDEEIAWSLSAMAARARRATTTSATTALPTSGASEGVAVELTESDEEGEEEWSMAHLAAARKMSSIPALARAPAPKPAVRSVPGQQREDKAAEVVVLTDSHTPANASGTSSSAVAQGPAQTTTSTQVAPKPSPAKEPIVIDDSPPRHSSSAPAPTQKPDAAGAQTAQSASGASIKGKSRFDSTDPTTTTAAAPPVAAAKRKIRFGEDVLDFADMAAGPDESAKKRARFPYEPPPAPARSPYEPPPPLAARPSRAFVDVPTRDYPLAPVGAASYYTAAGRDFERNMGSTGPAGPSRVGGGRRGESPPRSWGGRNAEADAHSAALIAPTSAYEPPPPPHRTISVLGGTASRPPAPTSLSSSLPGAPSKSRFGSAVINFDYDEDTDSDLESFSLKRKNGRKKAKLPANEQTTGSTNATGMSNKKPPIYFDSNVRFEVAKEPVSEATPSSTGMTPVDIDAFQRTVLRGGGQDIPFDQRTGRERDPTRKYDRQYHENNERIDRIADRNRGGGEDWVRDRDRDGDRHDDRATNRGRDSGVREDTYDGARERSRDRSRDWDGRDRGRDRDRDRDRGSPDGSSDTYRRAHSRDDRSFHASTSSVQAQAPAAAEEVSWQIDTRGSLPAGATAAMRQGMTAADWAVAAEMARQFQSELERPTSSSAGTSRGGEAAGRSRSAAPSRTSGSSAFAPAGSSSRSIYGPG